MILNVCLVINRIRLIFINKLPTFHDLDWFCRYKKNFWYHS